MKLSVIIPMYNEKEIIEETVKRLVCDLSAHFSDDYEILFSDDGSRDGGDEKIIPYLSERIRLLRAEENRGKGHAVRCGMMEAKGDYLFFTDCDLAYGTDYFLPAIEKMEKENSDVLIGSRALHPNGYQGYGFFRKCLSKMYFRFLSLVGGLSVSDSQTGFKGFRSAAAKQIFSSAEVDRFAFDYEALLLAKKYGFSVSELPVAIQNNRPSSMHFVKDSLRMVRDVIKMKKRIKKTK